MHASVLASFRIISLRKKVVVSVIYPKCASRISVEKGSYKAKSRGLNDFLYKPSISFNINSMYGAPFMHSLALLVLFYCLLAVLIYFLKNHRWMQYWLESSLISKIKAQENLPRMLLYFLCLF